MKTYAGVVATPEAEAQLESLIDLDIRYEVEYREAEWILRRDPELLSTPVDSNWIFLTQQKGNGPDRLALTWRVTAGQPQFVEVIDIRQYKS